MKKIIFILLFIFIVIPFSISASTGSLAMVNGKYYDNLEDAIKNTSSEDIITIMSNIELDDSLEIDKTVNINLNGNNITADEKVFFINGGFLTLTGKGMIKEASPNYGAIMLVGSTNQSDDKYSSVSIGKDVILEGWSGIFINHESSKSYGVNVYLEGKINAVNDINGAPGIGIYVNGNIKDEISSPIVNIKDGSEVRSTGTGLYIAGYSTFNIGDAYIEGKESAIGIKSGKLIIDGATLVCNGADYTPTAGYQNGMKPSGTTIQVESNSGYKGKIEIDISSGKFISENSNVIYEYIGKGNISQIYSISISGGTFESGKSKDVFSFSESFKDIHSGFISGGNYSTTPKKYLKKGYNIVKNNGIYTVVKNVMKEVNIIKNDSSNKNNFIKSLIFILVISIIVIFVYMKNMIKK